MRYITVTASKSITPDRAVLMGYALKATSALVANIRDGGVGGDIIIPIALANGTYEVVNTELPFNSDNGIYFEVVSGTVVGSIWVE